MAAMPLSHNALSSLDPSDCGSPGGQGPSADYHEAADWIVFLIPGGWTLQEYPHPGVRLLSAGQTIRASHGHLHAVDRLCHRVPCFLIRRQKAVTLAFKEEWMLWMPLFCPPPPPFLTDNEVLGAEDPHAQRVLCGVRRAARLSEWLHAEGRADESPCQYVVDNGDKQQGLDFPGP